MISSIFRFRSSTATTLFSRSSRVAGLLAFCVSVRTTALAPTTITLAEAAPYSKSFSTSTSKSKDNDNSNGNDNDNDNGKKHPNEGENGCLSYGRPLYPQDVYYNRKIKESLEKLRTLKREDADTAINADLLGRSGEKYMAALTLIGYKGGSLESQINQDRAVVVSPFWVGNNEKEEKQQQNNKRNKSSRLVGIFDGHARLGEVVSEYVVKELPKLLATKLDKLKPRDDPEQIKTAITDTFIELDKTCPGEISGGCTASIILQRDSKVYVANAGDSRSFLVVYRANSQTTDVIYISREDKPSLPDEKKRVEQMGGQVFLPPFGTSRVLYTDPESGLTSGLAMSRSIGDWEVGKLGVIPDPIVDIVDIEQVVHDQLKNGGINDDDVYIFAVSATDGLMDYTTPEAVAQTVATSMYDKDGPHLLTALETQIYVSAAGWEKAKRGNIAMILPYPFPKYGYHLLSTRSVQL